MQFMYYEIEIFYESSLYCIFESENFRFPFVFLRKTAWSSEWNVKNWTLQNRSEFIREASKIIHEWNVYLEILGRS